MDIGKWKQVDETTWRHPSGVELRIEKTEPPFPAGFSVVVQVDGYPATAVEFDGDSMFPRFSDTKELAIQYMKENPEPMSKGD